MTQTKKTCTGFECAYYCITIITNFFFKKKGKSHLYEVNHEQGAESRVVWPEYLRIRYFPGGRSPSTSSCGCFLIINETERVVTQGRRISITSRIHLYYFKIDELHIN